MPNVLDKIIESYEWLMMHTEGSARDAHQWHMALFNLEELKQFRKLGRMGYDVVFDDASDESAKKA